MNKTFFKFLVFVRKGLYSRVDDEIDLLFNKFKGNLNKGRDDVKENEIKSFE